MAYYVPLRTRIALIQLAAHEIFFAVGAIGVCIGTLAETMELYAICDDPDEYSSQCYDLNDARYIFSLTSQGLWAGVFIIVSAAFKIRFGKVPSKTREQWSTGFAVVAFIMALALFSLECVAAFGGSGYYLNLRVLHVTIFSLACMLFVFTLTTMILSATAVKGCCCQTRQNRTVPLGANQMPMMFGNPQAYNEQAFVGHASATAGPPVPGAEIQVPHAIRNVHLHNVGAAAVTGQNIAYNATSQQLSSQLPTADYPRQETGMRPPNQQSQVYPQLWTTGNQSSNAYMAAAQLMSSANPNHAHHGNQWHGIPQNLRSMKNRDLTAEQLQASTGGEYAAAGYGQQVQNPGSNASMVQSRATQPYPSANPMRANQSHQGQGMLSHVQPDNKNLATDTQHYQPFPGGEYAAAGYGHQVQNPGSNANMVQSRATQPFPTANPMHANQSHQGQGMLSHVQPDNKNLVTDTQHHQPFPGGEYVAADNQVQAPAMQEQQPADVQQAFQKDRT